VDPTEDDLQHTLRIRLVAMGNASPPAKAAADRITLSHAENGVAYALHQMLDGHW
jgi:hydroxymethylpyrimidine pyrophosphatase-like HAD family hydrolase